VLAEADFKIRTDPMEYGIDKVTEAAIKAVLPTIESVQNIQRRVLKAKHLVDVLQGWVIALDHRKKGLEKLVDLFQSSYFAAPRTKIKTRRGD
jgi:hypothetical protein